ncbi:uncharacterized protein LOC109796226 [Cajanus cajan]|uniref:BSD domain-containing protein n=1 Tax=Cajanus cajan TaxID=3821 RepID=A0A151TTQ9_CAJCA|nr:uncharacterized protein LOC109796226 [Cajanus cajan]KYP70381.1 hypothetical protein KK1_009597 [Cajanus cajan]
MSWLARSFANSLRLDGDGDGENDVVLDPPTTSSKDPPPENVLRSEPEEYEDTQGRGVKEDLDEIKQTLTRQFWGMASFLAPPPSNSQSDPSPFVSDQSNHRSISQPQLDDAAAVSDHSSDAEQENGPEPNSFSFGSDSEGNCGFELRAVGITEEVLAFAMNIAMHPETWLDFPIEEEDDTDDFDMSDAQQEHAAVVERLTPRLVALRIELCPCHMSESYFWKVYFVLLHSRLNKEDAGILSTPQVMAARAMWMQELQKQTKPEFEIFGRNASYPRDIAQHDDFTPNLSDDGYSDDMPNRTFGYRTTSFSMMSDYETDKHMVESSGVHFTDKSVIEENSIIKTENKDLKCGRPSHIIIQDYDDDDDEWPEEDSDSGGYGGTTHPMVNEEDISFSDLEDDDYGIKPVSSSTGSKVV